MKPMLACLTACLFAASAAQAQTAIQPIKMQMVQPNVQIAQVKDPALEVARLERENKRLREENEALKKRVDDFTRLGGSEVHAYCPAENPNLSRNTSGAENNCGAAGYTCEPVSGLCRTSCQTSDMCAGGFTCDTGAQQCVRTG
jgi:regulator of replication initiation timing